MKQLACLALFTYLFLAGFSVSSRAQYCYYDVAGGPCVRTAPMSIMPNCCQACSK